MCTEKYTGEIMLVIVYMLIHLYPMYCYYKYILIAHVHKEIHR